MNRVYPGYGLPLLGDPVIRDVVATPSSRKGKLTTVSDLLARGEAPDTAEPEVDSDSGRRGEGLDESFDFHRVRTLQEELIFIGRSLRRSMTKPSTPLHILLLADRLSIAEIAGRMRTDPQDVELHIAGLVSAGIVGEDTSGAVPRYSIIGLSGEQS